MKYTYSSKSQLPMPSGAFRAEAVTAAGGGFRRKITGTQAINHDRRTVAGLCGAAVILLLL